MNKNDTLAKYVRKVCTARFDDENKDMYYRNLIGDNGQVFTMRKQSHESLAFGQKAFIAKPVHTLKHTPKIFEIHEIIVPIPRFYFDHYQRLKNTDPKKARLFKEEALKKCESYYFRNSGNKTFFIMAI